MAFVFGLIANLMAEHEALFWDSLFLVVKTNGGLSLTDFEVLANFACIDNFALVFQFYGRLFGVIELLYPLDTDLLRTILLSFDETFYHRFCFLLFSETVWLPFITIDIWSRIARGFVRRRSRLPVSVVIGFSQAVSADTLLTFLEALVGTTVAARGPCPAVTFASLACWPRSSRAPSAIPFPLTFSRYSPRPSARSSLPLSKSPSPPPPT
jgi:hypothetical protein